MKLWIGGEIEADVADEFRLARLEVEGAINSALADREVDLELDAWDCIAIIRNDSEFAEIANYSAHKKEMDFRLAIDHRQFLQADHLGRCKLIVGFLLRSLDTLALKDVSSAAVDSLKSEVRGIATHHNWA